MTSRERAEETFRVIRGLDRMDASMISVIESALSAAIEASGENLRQSLVQMTLERAEVAHVAAVCMRLALRGNSAKVRGQIKARFGRVKGRLIDNLEAAWQGRVEQRRIEKKRQWDELVFQRDAAIARAKTTERERNALIIRASRRSVVDVEHMHPCEHGPFQACAPCLLQQLLYERDALRAYCDEFNAVVAKSAAMREVLRRLDRSGGLGLDVHERIRAALASDVGAALLERLRGLENQVAHLERCLEGTKTGRDREVMDRNRERDALASEVERLQAALERVADQHDFACVAWQGAEAAEEAMKGERDALASEVERLRAALQEVCDDEELSELARELDTGPHGSTLGRIRAALAPPRDDAGKDGG